ncbi:MAG TPA: T3SS effector HopA1 family protein [Pyrinomonadaceae bacterium]|jgi:hypothetical protein
MKEQLIKQLTKIIESTKILSPTEFSFAERILSYPVPPPINQPNPGSAQPPLISQLQNCFYQYCYVQPYNGNSPVETGLVTPNADLVEQLSAANETQEYWEAGWQIKEILPSGQIRAEKGGRSRLLWAGEFFTPQGFGMPPQINGYINVFFPKESTTIQPGFYYAFSQTFIDQMDDYNIVRFYWNIEEKGAPNLVRSISRNLNRFQVPYRFKCLNNQLPFNRTDSAVLFLNKRFYRIVAELLVDIYEEIKDSLGAETPLFSKQVAPGIGLAEDPNNGESFGMNRCRILAEGIWNGYTKGLQTLEARLDKVAGQFGVYGIALESPYLNAGAIDQYIIPKFETSQS